MSCQSLIMGRVTIGAHSKDKSEECCYDYEEPKHVKLSNKPSYTIQTSAQSVKDGSSELLDRLGSRTRLDIRSASDTAVRPHCMLHKGISHTHDAARKHVDVSPKTSYTSDPVRRGGSVNVSPMPSITVGSGITVRGTLLVGGKPSYTKTSDVKHKTTPKVTVKYPVLQEKSSFVIYPKENSSEYELEQQLSGNPSNIIAPNTALTVPRCEPSDHPQPQFDTSYQPTDDLGGFTIFDPKFQTFGSIKALKVKIKVSPRRDPKHKSSSTTNFDKVCRKHSITCTALNSQGQKPMLVDNCSKQRTTSDKTLSTKAPTKALSIPSIQLCYDSLESRMPQGRPKSNINGKSHPSRTSAIPTRPSRELEERTSQTNAHQTNIRTSPRKLWMAAQRRYLKVLKEKSGLSQRRDSGQTDESGDHTSRSATPSPRSLQYHKPVISQSNSSLRPRRRHHVALNKSASFTIIPTTYKSNSNPSSNSSRCGGLHTPHRSWFRCCCSVMTWMIASLFVLLIILLVLDDQFNECNVDECKS